MFIEQRMVSLFRLFIIRKTRAIWMPLFSRVFCISFCRMVHWTRVILFVWKMVKNVALALEEDKKQLEALQNAAKETASKLEGAHAQLQIAQKQLTQAKGHLKLFTNSSELLVDAQAMVASAKTELEEKKVEFETAFASFMAYQKEASEFRSRIEKIQSNEDGNKSAVAGEEEVTDRPSIVTGKQIGRAHV